MNQEFYEAAVTGDLDQIKALLAQDPALIRSADSMGFTALHGVAGEDHPEVASYLLDQGADPNAGNDEGVTPLHLAAYPSMAELLVKRGAEIDSRANDGSTPLLTQAAEAEGFEVMATLLQLGADAQAKDNAGQTALSIARAREEDDKVELLQGASPRWWKFW